jgi:hypothetical protein
VISFHTVLISLAQNTASQRASQIAPIHIIQKGIPILFAEIAPDCIISFIAARGQIALATSFAPCAKLKSPTANINGILKSLLINFFQFLNIELSFLY